MRLRTLIPLALLALLLAPATALAAAGVPSPNSHLILPADQVYALIVGSLTPLIGYVLNAHAPWLTEPVKAAVQIALAAVGGVIAQLVLDGDLALDTETLQVIGTAVIAALAAHKALWLPSGVAPALGGGQNRNTRRRG